MVTVLGHLGIGAAFGAAGLVVSLFESGQRAEALRWFSLAPIVIMTVVGVLRAGWILLAALTNRVYKPKGSPSPLELPSPGSRRRRL